MRYVIPVAVDHFFEVIGDVRFSHPSSDGKNSGDLAAVRRPRQPLGQEAGLWHNFPEGWARLASVRLRNGCGQW